MKKIRPITIILFLLAILLSATIFIMSSQEASESSETSGGICELLLKIFDSEFDELSQIEKSERIENLQFFVRKTAHFSAYALLCTLVLCALLSIRITFIISAITALAYSLIFSISDEIHQSFVPGRSCEIRDVIIDFCGAISGTLLILLIYRIKGKRSPK